jgi:hypothetical protein
MKRLLLILAALAALAAIPATASAAPSHFSRCPHEIKGVKDDPDFWIVSIYAKAMPCGSAYKDIFNYPAAAPPPHHYRGFTCSSKSYGPDGTKTICVAHQRAYSFIGEGL